MAITAAQAIAQLESNPAGFATPSDLLALASQVSIDAGAGRIQGSVTVLYRGKLNADVHTGTIVDQLMQSDQTRLINKTHISDFLDSDEF